MAYEVSIGRRVECPTAVVKANTTGQEFPALWRPMLDEVWAFLRTAPGLWSQGHNVMLYDASLPGGGLAVEVGVQVTRSFAAAGRVVPSKLPASEAAMTVHTGAAAEVGAAHSAVRAWCAQRDRTLTGISWEIYGDPNPRTGHFDISVFWQLS